MDRQQRFVDYVRRTWIVIMLFALCAHADNADRTRSSDTVENLFSKNNWSPNPGFSQLPDIVFDEYPNGYYQPNRQSPFAVRTNKQRTLATAPDNNSDDYESDRDSDSQLPYGIQNVRDLMRARGRPMRTKVTRETRVTYQTLCPTRRELVFLNRDTDYEYRPNHYEEVYCTEAHMNHHSHHNRVEDGVCGGVGFNCIQLNRTIFLTRKSPDTDCWESETRLIAAGCECMWPKHHFGDIGGHH